METSTNYLTAKQKLQYYCGYQDRNTTEVKKKLQLYSLTTEEIAQLIQSLIKDKFLDEDRYTTSFVNGRFFIKKWGKLKIYRELVSKNISPYTVQKALNCISEEDYTKTLLDLLLKKKATISAKNNFEMQRKLTNYLFQKGYELELIQKALHDILHP